MEDKKLDRRRFLTLVAQGSLGAAVVTTIGQVVRFLSFQPPMASSDVIPVGQPDGFVKEGMTYVAEARVNICHDGRGYYALDAVCTHLGCLVQQNEDGGFVCPCHESYFDAKGQPESGPATQPLRYLHLWLDAEQGQFFVDRARSVDQAVRLSI